MYFFLSSFISVAWQGQIWRLGNLLEWYNLIRSSCVLKIWIAKNELLDLEDLANDTSAEQETKRASLCDMSECIRCPLA